MLELPPQNIISDSVKELQEKPTSWLPVGISGIVVLAATRGQDGPAGSAIFLSIQTKQKCRCA